MINMSEDSIYKYLGLGVVSILAIYIGVKSLSFQAKVIEGMTNKSQNSEEFILIENMANISAENVKKQIDKLNDIIAVNKYRTDYENLLIALEEYANIMVFSKIVNIGKQVSDTGIGKNIRPETINEMNIANSIKSFIDTLNVSMKFIDRKK